MNHNQPVNNVQDNPLLSFDLIKNPYYVLGASNPSMSNQWIKQLTFHNCITALKIYENKSIEELRWEDYMLGRKYKLTPSQQATPSTHQCNSSSTLSLSTPCLTTNSFKYKPTPGMDIETKGNKGPTTKETVHKSISAMIEYQNYSFEELRLNDYKSSLRYPSVSANKKQQAAQLKTDEKPTSSINNIQESESTLASCPICLETIEKLKKDSIRLKCTQCGHVICTICYENLVKQAKKNSKQTAAATISIFIHCPTCRKIQHSHQVHDLFI